ncbi:tyrosine-type recombinase/integrase [Bacillus badius]|uniref:Integrase n=1 Tax=Bacillus badius TaxID=1455 RepID=A0ABR5APB7_BACBA|nr:tyrosine-type recombinase/integrase [Bacillus badius]KIL74183.1 Integrase [Bacillus badius]MED4718176.1 tyrosine-type recombinase/integrase [Bacillus badius]
MPYFRKITAKNKKGYKWMCVADGPPDPVTGKRKQISRRADSKSEALDLVEKAIKKLSEDGIDEKKIRNLPFEAVAWEWLSTYAKGKVKASTVRVREKEIKILLRYIAKVNIDKVTSRMHQKILNDLDEKEYAKTTIEGVHVTANMIFKYAIKEKMRKDNPCIGAVIPVKKLTVEDIENQTIEDKYLEREELFEFLEAAKEHGLPNDLEWFYLLAFSGMRSGEICALKWTDINFDTNEIRITKTLYNPDNNMKKYELTPPKTPGSIRTFDIDDSIIKMLRTHKAKQSQIKLANRKKYEDYHDANFVFCRENGYPFIQKNIIVRMKRLLKKTSIKKEATPHIFRHTHISMLAEAEVDINTIMKRVGHDDMKTTMNIYTHVTDKMKKNAAQKIKNHFGSILNLTKSQEM